MSLYNDEARLAHVDAYLAQPNLPDIDRESLREYRGKLVARIEAARAGSQAPPVESQAAQRDDQDNVDDMERDDLKMVYELRGEVALLRREIDELKTAVGLLRQDYGAAGSVLSPTMLNIMVIGGVVMMALLIFLTVRLV